MLSVAEARARLLDLVEPTSTEQVPLAQSAGRVLAGPVHALRTQPPFPASAMDGYAVRRDDATAGRTLHVIGEAAAGQGFDGTVGAGQAVRIFTGAPVPPGADDILIQEDTVRDGDQITVADVRDTARYIRPAGDDFSADHPFPGLGPLTPADISLLAAMNHAVLTLRRKPQVALIPTGDELVTPGHTPGPDQIVSSNVYGLAALLEQYGATARVLPIARDTSASLDACFALAEDADLIVTLGGASVGDHDLVQSTAVARGLEVSFYKVAMRPGKPLLSGRMRGTPLVGLPGNPVSAMACGVVFLQPMIRAFLGLSPKLKLHRGQLAHDLAANGPREHYMRGTLDEQGTVSVFSRQDSALLSVLQSANCLVVRPPHAVATPAGSPVDLLTLS